MHTSQHYNPQLNFVHQNEEIHEQVGQQVREWAKLKAKKTSKLEEVSLTKSNNEDKDEKDDCDDDVVVWFRYGKIIGLTLFPDGKMDKFFFYTILNSLHYHQQRRLATLYFQWHNTGISTSAAHKIVEQAVSLIGRTGGDEKNIVVSFLNDVDHNLPTDSKGSIEQRDRSTWVPFGAQASDADEEIVKQIVHDKNFAHYFPKLTPENIVTVFRWFFESRKDNLTHTFTRNDNTNKSTDKATNEVDEFPTASDDFADFDNLKGRLAETLYSRKLVAYERCCRELQQLSRDRVLLHELVKIAGQYLPVME